MTVLPTSPLARSSTTSRIRPSRSLASSRARSVALLVHGERRLAQLRLEEPLGVGEVLPDRAGDHEPVVVGAAEHVDDVGQRVGDRPDVVDGEVAGAAQAVDAEPRSVAPVRTASTRVAVRPAAGRGSPTQLVHPGLGVDGPRGLDHRHRPEPATHGAPRPRRTASRYVGPPAAENFGSTKPASARCVGRRAPRDDLLDLLGPRAPARRSAAPRPPRSPSVPQRRDGVGLRRPPPRRRGSRPRGSTTLDTHPEARARTRSSARRGRVAGE